MQNWCILQTEKKKIFSPNFRIQIYGELITMGQPIFHHLLLRFMSIRKTETINLTSPISLSTI